MNENYSIMENAEEFYFPGNQVGVLVSHGFTGTTQSMHYLGKRIADEGYTVYGPRLTGHGTHYEDMEKATNKDWITDVEAGLEKLKKTCSDIFIVGLSMGGTLALYLAEHYPEISGIMPINAATNLPEMKGNYEEFIYGKERFIDGIGSDIKQDGVEELAYAKTPVKSMGELLRLTDLVREDLTKITVPTLVFSSLVDHVVPPENSIEIYKNIDPKDKTIAYLENSYHVATLDNDKALIAETCISFIGDHLGDK